MLKSDNNMRNLLQNNYNLTIEECEAFCRYIFQDGRNINPKILMKDIKDDYSHLIQNLHNAIELLYNSG